MNSFKGSLMLFIGCLLMGSMGVFANSIRDTHPVNILLLRYSFTLFAFAIFLLAQYAAAPTSTKNYITRNLQAFKNSTALYWSTGLVSALVMATYVFGTLLFSLGLSVVMLYTATIYLPFTEKIVRRYFIPSLAKTSFGSRYYISSVANLVGLLLIVGSSLSDTTLNIAGLLSSVASGFLFSIMMVMVRGLKAAGFDSEQTLVSGTVVGVAIFIPFAFIFPISITAPNMVAATGLGAFATAVGGLFYFRGFGAVRADLAPLLAYFEPIFGSLLALLFLGERYSTLAVAGILIIMGTNFTYTLISQTVSIRKL